MLEKKYLTVYDFRILPIALGDILQWLALKKLEIIQSGYHVADLIIVYPNNFQGNLINEIRHVGYWDVHFTEMVKVFKSTDFIEKVIITSSLDFDDLLCYANGLEVFQENEELVKNIKCSQAAVWRYIRAHQSFEPFNSYFNKNGERVILGSKQEVIDETVSLLNNQGLAANDLLVCQPRFRMIDSGLPFSDPFRDSIYIAWANFFEKVDAKCVLIGRVDSIPLVFKNFKNIYIAREIGMGIEHELALLRCGRFFLGASSGFAIAAHFSNVSHKIFGVKKPGFENYGLSVDSEKLIFSFPQQGITKEEINLEDLNNFDYTSNNLRDESVTNYKQLILHLISSDYLKMKNNIEIEKLMINYHRFHDFKFGILSIKFYADIILPIKIFYLKITNYKNVLQKQLFYGTLLNFIIEKLYNKLYLK